MKKIWFLCALMAALCSCSETLEPIVTPEVESLTESDGLKITATIAMPNDSETKIASDFGQADSETWKFTWEEKDKTGYLYAFCKTGESSYATVALTSSDLAAGATTATFTGTLPANTVSYRVIYSPSELKWGTDITISTLTSATPTLNLSSSQNGTLDNLVMISEIYTADGTDASISPSLKHVGGFLELGITFSNVPVHWDGIKISSITCSGFNTESSLDLAKEIDADGFYGTPTTSEDIVITPSEDIVVTSGSSKSLYLNILPTEIASSESVKVVVNFSNGTHIDITKELKQQLTFSRAKFSTISVEYDFNNASSESTDDGAAATTKTSFLYYSFADGDYPNLDNTKKSFEIATPSQLAALAALANSAALESESDLTFKLTKDIDLNEDGDGSWIPIGYASNATFKGTFDGAGYSVIDYSASSHNGAFISLGLFGYVSGSSTVVKNLIIENGDSHLTYEKSGTHVGILTGTLFYGATLLNCGCDANSSVSQAYSGAIGGLVGYAYGTSGSNSDYCKIYNCYNQGSVESTYTEANTVEIGGLCGSARYTYINNCYNTGTVTLSKTESESGNLFYRGALVGDNGTLTCTSCYYLEGCAGTGVLAIGSGNVGNSIDSGTTSKTDDDMQLLASTLNSGNNDITDAVDWENVSGDYPVLVFAN